MRSTLVVLSFLLVQAASSQSFGDLQAAVAAADESERQGLAHAFLESTSIPHFENDTTAVFLYEGQAASVSVSGDFNGWSGQGWALQRLASTSLWYRIEHFEADARLDYKVILNGSNWILDPGNPLHAPGGFGANSELAMPAYVQPWEIIKNAAVAEGTLVSHTFDSTIMGNSRAVNVYLPAGYDANRTEPYPVIVYHDGSDYLNLASIETVFDNLIDAGRIEPLIAVFANPLDRENEYATNDTGAFSRLIVEELMPWVEANYHIATDPARRAVTGPSYAGLASARHCFEHPDVFGLCAPFSPSFWVSNGALLDAMSQGDLTAIKWYVDWGTYEQSIASSGHAFEDILQQQGATFRTNEWHEGHSWGSWRAHQDIMLEYFFPGVNATSRSTLEQPDNNLGISVFPNPASSTATISFALGNHSPVNVSVHDILGREVGVVLDHDLYAGQHSFTMDRPGSASGVYWVRVSTALSTAWTGVTWVR